MTVSNKPQSGRSRIPRISSTAARVPRSRPLLPQIWTTPSSSEQSTNIKLLSAQSLNTEPPTAQSSKAQSSTTRQPSWARPTQSSQLRQQHTERQNSIRRSSQVSQPLPSGQPSWSKAFSRVFSTNEKNICIPSSPDASQPTHQPRRPISAASSESFNVGLTITSREGSISREELIRNAVSNGRASRASWHTTSAQGMGNGLPSRTSVYSPTQMVGTAEGVARCDVPDSRSLSALSRPNETLPVCTVKPSGYEIGNTRLSSRPSVLSIPTLVRKTESGNPESSSIKKTLNRKPASRQLSAQYQRVLPLAKAQADLVRSEIQGRLREDSEENVEPARDTAESAGIGSDLKDSELQSLGPDQIDHIMDVLLLNEDEEEKQLELEWSRTLERIRSHCREVSDMYTTLNKNIKIQGAVQDKNRRKMLELSELVSESKPSSAMSFSDYESDPETGIEATSRSQSSLRNKLIHEEAERYPRFASYKNPSAPLPASTPLVGRADSEFKKITHTSSQLSPNETNWPEDTRKKVVDSKLEENSIPSPPSSPNPRLDLTLEKTRHVSFQIPPALEPAPTGPDSTDTTTARASSPAPVPSPPSPPTVIPTHDSDGVPLISPYASDPGFNVDYDYGLGTDQHFVDFYPLTEYEVRMTTEFNEFTQSVPIFTNLDLMDGDLVPVGEVLELGEDTGDGRGDEENGDAGCDEEDWNYE